MRELPPINKSVGKNVAGIHRRFSQLQKAKIPLRFFVPMHCAPVLRLLFAACLGLILMSGCAEPVAEVDEPSPRGLGDVVTLPGTFTGSIPCDDCERVDIVLNVRPDSLYQLRKTYQSTSGPLNVDSQMGRWRFSPGDSLLILGKEKGRLKTYRVVGNDLLRFVEWEGGDSSSQIQYELSRSPAMDPFPDPVKMRGMFSSVMELGYFSECATGVKFAVDEGGDFRTTVQNYMNTPHDADHPLLVSILGSLSPGAGPGAPDTLYISQFRRFYPNRDCEGNTIRANLTGTHWVLTEIDGSEVDEEPAEEPRYLTFEPDRTLHGYGGCNRISGTYLVKGDVFLFNRELTTRVACGTGMDIENQILRALDESETYRIEGQLLQLIDQNDEVRARFLAGQ